MHHYFFFFFFFCFCISRRSLFSKLNHTHFFLGKDFELCAVLPVDAPDRLRSSKCLRRVTSGRYTEEGKNEEAS